MITEDGRRVATALTSESGSFFVRAPAPGTFTVEVKRIGVRLTRLGPFQLVSGESREESVIVRAVPLLQPEVRVSGKSSCVLQQNARDVTGTLWENARAALAAVKLTEEGGLAHARVTRIFRDIDAQSLRVVKESRTESFALGNRPFASAPAESLSKLGYVRRDGNGFLYFAPDAGVILSDVFLADHCFRAVRADKKDSTLVGLGFEPTARKQTADVSGVLWMDRRTYELRSIEFIYENPPPPHERGQAGGSVHFKRLPGGAGWMVDRWFIRWPRFAGMSRQDPNSGAVVFGNRTVPSVMAYREEGGEATLVGADDAGFGVVRGTVLDGDLGRPVRGARVVASQGGIERRRVASAADGAFVLDTLPAGTYTLTVTLPRFDSLGVRGHSAELRVKARDSLTVPLALPREAEVWKAICPDDPDMADHALVRVLVTSGKGGDPIPGVIVRIAWNGAGATGLTTSTDDDGTLVACKLPVDRPVRVSVLVNGREVVGRGLALTPAGMLVVPLAVPFVNP